MTEGPLLFYRAKIASGEIAADAAQARAAQRLQHLHEELADWRRHHARHPDHALTLVLT